MEMGVYIYMPEATSFLKLRGSYSFDIVRARSHRARIAYGLESI